MPTFDWIEHNPARVTVCDEQGTIIAMNRNAAASYARFGGSDLIGTSLFACHNEHSNALLREQMSNQHTRTYITQKKEVRFLVQHSPWYDNDRFGGLVETVLELPDDIPVQQR